jgi:hypothetical protein
MRLIVTLLPVLVVTMLVKAWPTLAKVVDCPSCPLCP